MIFARHLWLLLCYAQCSESSVFEEYSDIYNNHFYSKYDEVILPIELPDDKASGCTCRASKNENMIVCFGNDRCKKFPKISLQNEILKVRTTAITEIIKGDLDPYIHVKILEIEANYKLEYLQPGLFRNMTFLEHLSISYNSVLQAIEEDTFEGLINLKNLTLVNNGFTNILQLTPAFRPHILPSLTGLDLSENVFEQIPENSFSVMEGTTVKRFDVNLCRIEFVHPKSILPFKSLKVLHIGENDLNSTIIGNFLIIMKNAGINLTYLDLSGMGFRKQPARMLLNIIALTTIKRLDLSKNQFEIITDDAFPIMPNIEVLDLRKVLAIHVGPLAFDPRKFPNLKVLLLGMNNLHGLHQKHLSDQLLILDMANNLGSSVNPMLFDITRDTFVQSRKLVVLNLAYNRIKAVFDYTFRGLNRLKILDMENGTLYHIGSGTFKATRELEFLNLANNPLTVNVNLTSSQFEGLNHLKSLIMTNCGIKNFNDDDNIFEMMPNLTHLILKNNFIYFITAETLKPMKDLQVLDLSDNLLTAWWSPLFLSSGIVPRKLYLGYNKISRFTLSMIEDINFLQENHKNYSTKINFMDNIFICDCNSMLETYLWLEANNSLTMKQFFLHSEFQCTTPDVWENRRVAEYIESIKSVHCIMYEKLTNVMVIVWTAHSLITIALVASIFGFIYRYRIYFSYWLFLAKISLSRSLSRKITKSNPDSANGYKYDAFVSYCNEDREFVSEMTYQLEGSPPYLKLCIYERDFEIGAFISEAVLSSINQSRYVILIISNNFAKSQWCRWETQLAEYHRLFLEDGTSYDPLVLIRVGDVENKYLTMTLKYLLKTKIYHCWDETRAEEFWTKLRNVLIKNN